MAQRKPQHRRVNDVVHDPRPEAGAADLIPDDLRHRDQPDVKAPDTVPRHEDPNVTDTRPDGGVAQHPVHDEDQEDVGPEGYEEEFASDLARVDEPASEESQEMERSADEFDAEELGPESIPPDDRDRGPGND